MSFQSIWSKIKMYLNIQSRLWHRLINKKTVVIVKTFCIVFSGHHHPATDSQQQRGVTKCPGWPAVTGGPAHSQISHQEERRGPRGEGPTHDLNEPEGGALRLCLEIMLQCEATKKAKSPYYKARMTNPWFVDRYRAAVWHSKKKIFTNLIVLNTYFIILKILNRSLKKVFF